MREKFLFFPFSFGTLIGELPQTLSKHPERPVIMDIMRDWIGGVQTDVYINGSCGFKPRERAVGTISGCSVWFRFDFIGNSGKFPWRPETAKLSIYMYINKRNKEKSHSVDLCVIK